MSKIIQDKYGERIEASSHTDSTEDEKDRRRQLVRGKL
jgi:hypothetical protein